MAEKRVIVKYKGNQIIANASGAKIYPQNHFIEGSSIDESVANAKTYIDLRYEERKRRRPEKSIGTVDDYEEALNGLKLGGHETKMLTAHYRAKGRRLTANEISQSAGWKSSVLLIFTTGSWGSG